MNQYWIWEIRKTNKQMIWNNYDKKTTDKYKIQNTEYRTEKEKEMKNRKM